ncbi:DUF4270 domain-containing protein [Sphingobacteriales bacterium UPWRP_1]|nr:hypothetical protein B6N25_09795 [Sphingobacteriales bacterium TSM_CSS]PSJ73106.1 DUF4270 domain-containing protein [Sphingobacteriales bacterium UPWRP_1]
MKKLLPVLAAWAVFGFQACTESTSIGADLIDDGAFPDSFVIDTVQMKVNTFTADSIQTAPPLSGIPYLLGAVNDEACGAAAMHIFTQIVPQTNNISLGDSLQLDSVVLQLDYAGTTLYGQAGAPASITVYELTETITPGIVYYSNKKFAFNQVPLGYLANALFTPADSITLFNKIETDQNGTDSLTYFKAPPHLRIKLSQEFGNRLLAQSGTINMADKNSFQQFFKGFYIAAASNGNTVAYIDMFGTYSRLTLYYRQGSNKNRILNFPIGSLSAMTNYFTHNYTGSNAGTALAAAEPNGQETVYLQGAAGLGFSVELLNLNAYSNFAVNKAELEFTALPTTYELYKLPTTLEIMSFDTIENVRNRIITSAVLEEETASDGQVLSKYKFVFSFYTQQKINGDVVNAIEQVFLDFQRSNPNRIILGGPQHPQYPMKMSMVCTTLQ